MTQLLRSFFFCLLLAFIPFHAFSQNRDVVPAKNYCATDNLHEGLYKTEKSYQEKFNKMNADWQQWAIDKEKEQGVKRTASPNDLQATGDETLPVIFHMMIGTTTSPNPATSATDGNLTKTQIQNALTVLNKIYSGQVTGSKPASLNTHIQFCLAEVDSKGMAISSYTYTNPLTGPLDNNQPGQISALSNVVANTGKFPTTKYINVYVVDDIAGSVAGFAFMPSAHGQPSDGIYIEAQYLLPPVSGNDLSFNMTVMSHEMGHYLGLFHTFGICKTLTQTCSCYNNNCLFDGDMICDTPPDYSQDFITACSTTTNTCHTDNTPAITDGTHPASDMNDLINNYMDYGNWNCENTFTAGQVKRMHFMIDKYIGPRNSLLNSTACNPVCATTCTVVIDPITTTNINGINLPNTLILSGASVSYNFSGSLCGSYNSKNWSAINLTTNAVIQSATTSGFNVTFTSIGNYRILLKEYVAGSNPVCYQTDTLDIQILPPPNCPANLDMTSGWLNNWQRIQYEGGWARNDDGSFAFPTTTMTLVPPTVANSTATLSPFSMVSSLSADPNFSTTPLPAGVTNMMRVGKMITTSGNILPGDAAYITYTFCPTQANSKLRVYYLGMKEQDNGGYLSYSNFSSNTQLATTFGFVCNYKFNSLNGNGIVERGLLHTGSNGNTIYGKNDMVAGAGVHRPTAYTTVQVGTNMYDRMTGWEFQDLDFSLFACGVASPTITITFFARSDNSNNLGYKHSYAYFAAKCLPGTFSNTDLNLSNVDIACANNVSESCTQALLPVPYNLDSQFNWGYYVDYRDMLKINTEESNNNITYTPSSTGYYITTSPPFAIPFVNLCKAPDNNPFKYFKITYSNLCQTKTDTISVFQGYVHDLTCAPNSTVSLSGGHFVNAPVPPSLTSPDAYIQFCGTTTLNLTPPCWWQPGDPAPEYKWKYGVQEIPGETSASLVLGTPNMANYVNVCASYTRFAKYNDPYCGGSTWISSDFFLATDLRHNYFNTNDIIGPDTCSNQPARIEIDNFYEQNPVSGCDEEMLARAQTAPTVNSVAMSFFSNSNCTPSASLTATNGPSVLTFTCLNSFSRYAGAYNNGPINTSFTFNNNGIYNQDGTVYMLVRVTRYGCVSTFTVPVTIKIKPSAIAGTIAPVTNGCLNPTQITGDDANVNVLVGIRYQWQYSYTSNFASSVTISGANSFSCNIPSPATFTTYPVYIRRMSLGTNDCQKPAYSNVITLNPTPYNLSVTASALTICQGNTVTLTASGANTYTWMPGNVTGAVKTFTPATSTIYTVTGTTSNNCIATKTISISLQSNITPTIAVTSTSICAGSSVTLTVTGPTNFTLTGGGTTTTSNSIVVNPTATTVYSVTNVCGSIKTITITVSPIPVITIIPTAPTICAGTSIILSASGAATYTWTGGGINVENPATVSPTATTIYTVTGKNTTGCSSTKTVVVTVNPLPTLNISPASPSICAGSVITLTASGASTYTWTGVATASSTVNPQIVSPTVTTIYTVTGANDVACKSIKTVTVNVIASPSLTVAPATSTICSGATATLTASGATSYTWANGAITYTSNPLSANPGSITIYTVTGITAGGCTGINTATVFVLPAPKLTVSPASSTICAGTPVTLTASGATSYTWSSPLNGSTNTVTAGPLTVAPNNTIIYTVTAVNTNGCKSSAMITVNVNPKPSLATPASQTVCLGNSATINIPTTIGFTYSISPLPTNTIVPIDGQLIFYVTPTTTTIYTLTAVNPVTGCTATSTTQVNVLPATPTVNLVASANPICIGSSATLTASGALYYGWTGGGLTSTSGTVVVTPTVSTKYTVYGSNTPFTLNPMTAVCYGRGVVIIDVLPTPTLTVSGPTVSLCTGNCTALAVSGANTYIWNTGATTSSVTVCPTATTNYTVTGIDISGCRSSAVKTVSILPTPVLTILPVTPTVCIGSSITLSAAGATSYTWAGGGITTTLNPVVVTPTVTTTYTVIGSNGNGGCVINKTITIEVLLHADKPIAITVKPKTACSGKEIELVASGASTYVWTSNPISAISQSTTGTTIYSFPTSTTTYSVLGTESNGCTEQTVVTVTVLPTPTITVVSSPSLICVKNTATLTASGAQTYTWTSSVTSAITQNSTGNPKVTNALGGGNVTFTASGTGSNGCIGWGITTVSVSPDCPQTDNCNMIQCIDGYIPAFRYLSPASVTSTSVTVRNGSMYMHQAIVPFGIYTPSCPKPVTHTVSYNWTLIKTAGANAPQTICNNVTTKDFTWSNLSDGLYSLTMEMIIKQTINGITYSCTLTYTSQFGIGTGYYTTPPIFKTIAEESQESLLSVTNLKIYPNPATNEVMIDWDNIGDEKVQELGLYDMNGKLIVSALTGHAEKNYMLDTKQFANGLYFIRLKTDKQVYMQKLAIYK